MTSSQSPKSRKIGFGLVSGVVIAAVAFFVAGREFSFLSDEIAKRGVALMIGLMLITAGNFLPKLVLPLEAARRRSPAVLTAERSTGWVLVLTGLLYSATILLAPITNALFLGGLVGLGGFLIIAANWTRIALSGALRGSGDDETPALTTPGRMSALLILNALLWVFAMFVVDAIWGDTAGQWLAVIFVIVNGFLAVTLGREVFRGEGEAE